MNPLRVIVVVAGDVGRSPRMQYHALAFAATDAEVELVGLDGSALPAALARHPQIAPRLRREPERTRPASAAGYLFHAAWRALVHAGWLARALVFRRRAADVLLVQSPPAIPTLAVAILAARVRGAKLVVDWHNFGWAMLALRLGRAHPVVALVRWLETRLGRRADAHLCVSSAMREELARKLGIEATVLRDRPAEAFSPTPLAARAELFRRIHERSRGRIAYDPTAPDRPALVVTATSWSADEDFTPLLDALASWDAASAAPGESLPCLLVLITGRGPLRAAFERRLAVARLERAEVHALWLDPEEYPALLGAADLGLSFHRSASGVDLPMKVSDMFGAGLPVCALDYGPCLAELVRHRENGLVFATGEELANGWRELLAGFPRATPLIEQLRANVAAASRVRWGAGWALEAAPLFARA